MIKILHGDCRDILPTLPAESVHCVVTSPPYWGLRDYGVDGQLGLERTPEEWVENMVGVFREVRRVLRSDGTLWLNVGDCYSTNLFTRQGEPRNVCQPPNDWEGTTLGGRESSRHVKVVHQEVPGLKPKDLVGQPWRLAFALQADGWWLRSDIIWAKPNPMPESVGDRPTKSKEYVFLLAKSARYYWDAEAVRENVTGNAHSRGCGTHPKNAEPGSGVKMNSSFSAAVKDIVSSRNLRDVWEVEDDEWAEFMAFRAWKAAQQGDCSDVWTIPTQPYPGAHFATFPRRLVEPCLRAGTSERGCCPECGTPWRRVVEREFVKLADRRPSRKAVQEGADMADINSANEMGYNQTTTTGWTPTCDHDAEPVACTVLDPFLGSGTVAEVAQDMHLNCIGIELSPEYISLAKKRISQPTLPFGAPA